MPNGKPRSSALRSKRTGRFGLVRACERSGESATANATPATRSPNTIHRTSSPSAETPASCGRLARSRLSPRAEARGRGCRSSSTSSDADRKDDRPARAEGGSGWQRAYRRLPQPRQSRPRQLIAPEGPKASAGRAQLHLARSRGAAKQAIGPPFLAARHSQPTWSTLPVPFRPSTLTSCIGTS